MAYSWPDIEVIWHEENSFQKYPRVYSAHCWSMRTSSDLELSCGVQTYSYSPSYYLCAPRGKTDPWLRIGVYSNRKDWGTVQWHFCSDDASKKPNITSLCTTEPDINEMRLAITETIIRTCAQLCSKSIRCDSYCHKNAGTIAKLYCIRTLFRLYTRLQPSASFHVNLIHLIIGLEPFNYTNSCRVPAVILNYDLTCSVTM
jgi:hypothetical protein